MTKTNGHGLPVLSGSKPQSKDPRRRLFALNRLCFWCGRITRLSAEIGDPDLATVDHLYSRLHPKRTTRKTKVLACRECNLARGVADQRGIVFVPKLPFRADAAMEASAANWRSAIPELPSGKGGMRQVVEPKLPKPQPSKAIRAIAERRAVTIPDIPIRRSCKHMPIDNVLMAHDLAHVVRKITGLRTTVTMCRRCCLWSVKITDKLTKAKKQKVQQLLLSQSDVGAVEYVN